MGAAARDFTRHLRESIRAAMETDAMAAAQAASKAGDSVAAAHHAARANALHDSWRIPDAQREVDAEAISQLRGSLSHPDPDVRESARQGLEELGVMAR
ncbi:MAG: hypothetical protein ACHQ0J_01320 [Candidatus Dormibacterales bacterium]